MKQKKKLCSEKCLNCICWKYMDKIQDIKSIEFKKYITRKIGLCLLNNEITTEDYCCNDNGFIRRRK